VEDVGADLHANLGITSAVALNPEEVLGVAEGVEGFEPLNRRKPHSGRSSHFVLRES
jgi:hypothetical protein